MEGTLCECEYVWVAATHWHECASVSCAGAASAMALVRARGLLHGAGLLPRAVASKLERSCTRTQRSNMPTRACRQVLEVHIPGRTGKQIRERWHNQIDPNVKKDKWSKEEDDILIEAHSRLGASVSVRESRMVYGV